MFRFQIDRPGIGTVTIDIRNPEFGDVSEFARRQRQAETEAGVVFVQDLGVDLEFFRGTWTNLQRCERRDMEFFFGPEGTNYRQRPFTMSVINNKNIAFGIGTGQGWSTADDLESGSLVVPASASFGLVKLEQSSLQFSTIPTERYTVDLAFRILTPPSC